MINKLREILRNYADEHDLLYTCKSNTMTNVYGFYFRDKEGTWIFWKEYTSREIREWDGGVEALAAHIIYSLEKKIRKIKEREDDIQRISESD